ncbi:Protein asteroid 1, partial [Massospora cicadina]
KLETVNEILPHLEKLGCGHKQEFTREKIIPILAVEIFLETLKEMNQTIIMAEEEADQPAAFYARRFDAAVVSNDSDFIVYDLPHGFLYLPSFFVSESVLEALSRFDFYQTAISDSVVVFLQFKVLRYCNSKVCEHLKIKSLHFSLAG